MADSQGFVGSWQVIVSFAQGPPSRSPGTIDADGTIVASIAPVMPWPGAPGDVLFSSSAHGAWSSTGSDSRNWLPLSDWWPTGKEPYSAPRPFGPASHLTPREDVQRLEHG